MLSNGALLSVAEAAATSDSYAEVDVPFEQSPDPVWTNPSPAPTASPLTNTIAAMACTPIAGKTTAPVEVSAEWVTSPTTAALALPECSGYRLNSAGL